MKKYLLFFVLFINTSIYSMSTSPKTTAPLPTQLAPLIQFEFYDRDNNSIIYDSIPLLFGESNQGLLSIQPSISRNTITGEGKFQLWIAHFPIYGTLGEPKLIAPNYLVISTLRRNIKLPIMFKQFIPPTEGPPIPGQILDAQETGYIYLFSDDVKNLKLLFLDTDTAPIDVWDPQKSEDRLTILEENKITYTPSIYKQRNLDNYRILQTRAQLGRYKKANTFVEPIIYQGTPADSPLLLQQKSIQFTLYGDNGKISWNIPPSTFWVLFEAIEFYEQIEKFGIPLPY